MPKKQPIPDVWWQQIKERLQDYPDWIVESGVAGLIGLVVGFMCRNFGRALFFFCVSALIALFVLEQSNLIAFRAMGLKALFNNPDKVVLFWANSLAAFVREHIFVSISLLIGFLLGWRLGK